MPSQTVYGTLGHILWCNPLRGQFHKWFLGHLHRVTQGRCNTVHLELCCTASWCPRQFYISWQTPSNTPSDMQNPKLELQQKLFSISWKVIKAEALNIILCIGWRKDNKYSLWRISTIVILAENSSCLTAKVFSLASRAESIECKMKWIHFQF